MRRDAAVETAADQTAANTHRLHRQQSALDAPAAGPRPAPPGLTRVPGNQTEATHVDGGRVAES